MYRNSEFIPSQILMDGLYSNEAMKEINAWSLPNVNELYKINKEPTRLSYFFLSFSFFFKFSLVVHKVSSKSSSTLLEAN